MSLSVNFVVVWSSEGGGKTAGFDGGREKNLLRLGHLFLSYF